MSNNKVQSLGQLGIHEDEFEIHMTDEEDGGATIELELKSDEAQEIFRAACARAGLSQDQYLRLLILGD